MLHVSSTPPALAGSTLRASEKRDLLKKYRKAKRIVGKVNLERGTVPFEPLARTVKTFLQRRSQPPKSSSSEREALRSRKLPRPR